MNTNKEIEYQAKHEHDTADFIIAMNEKMYGSKMEKMITDALSEFLSRRHDYGQNPLVKYDLNDDIKNAKVILGNMLDINFFKDVKIVAIALSGLITITGKYGENAITVYDILNDYIDEQVALWDQSV